MTIIPVIVIVMIGIIATIIKLIADVGNINDVLTRESTNGKKEYVGSELDGKVEQKDFDYLRERVIGSSTQRNLNSLFYRAFIEEKTLFQEIESLNERFDKLEKHLGIERVQKEEKIDKYISVPKKKKNHS
jgi:hypothetical protein